MFAQILVALLSIVAVMAENSPVNGSYNKKAADRFIVIGFLVIVIYTMYTIYARHYINIERIKKNDEKLAKQQAASAKATAPARQSMSVGK